MNFWFIIILLLCAWNLGFNCAVSGQTTKAKYSVRVSLVSSVLWVSLVTLAIFQGGF